MAEMAWSNLVRALQIPPDSAWEVTYPEYLTLMLAGAEADAADSGAKPDKVLVEDPAEAAALLQSWGTSNAPIIVR